VRLSRRLIPAAVGVILLVVVIAVASAGSNHQPRFSFGAISVATGAPTAPVRPVPAPPFRPAPAAVAVANRMPLAQQVAQLFMVGIDGSGPDADRSIGIPDVGGVVLTSANFVSDSQVGTLVGDLKTAAHSAGAQPPLIAATQALEAGDDVLYLTGPASEHLQAYDAVLAAAQRSALARRLVQAALLRDLTLKERYGALVA
jgi:beta-glucosidase-like glycosyl hydrolase